MYGAMDVDQLRKERERLEVEIKTRAGPQLESQLQRGRYEVVGKNSKYEPNGIDPGEVFWVRVYPNGVVVKVTLPEAGNAETYAVKACSAWIQMLMDGTLPAAK